MIVALAGDGRNGKGRGADVFDSFEDGLLKF